MTTVRAVPLRSGTPDGPLVVLAHGLEDSWDSWARLAALLDPAWRVYALDLPWRPGNDYHWRYGRSSGSWLVEALSHVDGSPDLVVAHSFGANAVLESLTSNGHGPVPLLALLCPLYCPPEQAITWRVFDRSRRTFDQHIRDGLRVRLANRSRALEPELVETMMGLAVDRIGPAGFLAVFEQFVASRSLPLATITTPTLVLAAGDDPTMSRETAEKLARDMPVADVRFHEHYDHFCHLGYAADVADQILLFFGASVHKGVSA